jgi:predicted acetyltransferase
LGITEKKIPFICLGTASELLANEYKKFLKSTINKNLNSSRNKRDNFYNITVHKEDAQAVVSKLYYKDCLCLDRKGKIAYDILAWMRNKNYASFRND